MMRLLADEVFIKPARLFLRILARKVRAFIGWIVIGGSVGGLTFAILTLCGIAIRVSALLALLAGVVTGSMWLRLIVTFPRYDNRRSRSLSIKKKQS